MLAHLKIWRRQILFDENHLAIRKQCQDFLDGKSLHKSYLQCTQCLVAVVWLGKQRAPNHIKLFTIGVQKSFECNFSFIALGSWSVLATSLEFSLP